MLPPVTDLISRYGLAVVAIGALIEGETVLLAAGALVSRGVLKPGAVWIAAASGAWLGHVIWFAVGRLVGRRRLVTIVPQWQRAMETLDALIRKRPWTCIFSLQYLYGMRLPGAMALGLSGLRVSWFLAAEAVNCLIWAAVVGTLGYIIGESAAAIIRPAHRILWLVASLLLIIAVVYRAVRYKPTGARGEMP